MRISPVLPGDVICQCEVLTTGRIRKVIRAFSLILEQDDCGVSADRILRKISGVIGIAGYVKVMIINPSPSNSFLTEVEASCDGENCQVISFRHPECYEPVFVKR